ncbi:hypothetical protein BJ508DRAFT_11433 [Ascobolus immersus RN42]|uniref:Uncharacterized protein n=1 Tax=Ascobolus immersus RN42 TaxID=1160509 RepID=A0A3N4HSX8_ASCIM|nr:hypothetical protein BJ508DRAFT_11433 [Ascobolus immersus RN42]
MLSVGPCWNSNFEVVGVGNHAMRTRTRCFRSFCRLSSTTLALFSATTTSAGPPSVITRLISTQSRNSSSASSPWVSDSHDRLVVLIPAAGRMLFRVIVEALVGLALPCSPPLSSNERQRNFATVWSSLVTVGCQQGGFRA